MASLQLVPHTSPEVISPESLDVAVLDFEMRAAAKMYRQASMRVAYFGFRLRFALMDDWSPLGVKDEEEYRQKLGIGQSTFYKLLRIGQALYTVKLADMEKISVGNAELLIQVEPALWHDFPWVQEAQKLSPDDFSKLIVQRHRQVGSQSEPMTYFRAKVPYSAKKFLIETLDKFRLEHGLNTAGEALEYLVADVHDRPNVMVAIERANRYLNWVVFRLQTEKLFAEEMQWLLKGRRLLKKAYAAIRMQDEGDIHEEDEKEIYPAKSPAEFQDYRRWSREVPVEPSGADGEEASGDDAVSATERDLCAVRSADGPDPDDDSVEEQ